MNHRSCVADCQPWRPIRHGQAHRQAEHVFPGDPDGVAVEARRRNKPEGADHPNVHKHPTPDSSHTTHGSSLYRSPARINPPDNSPSPHDQKAKYSQTISAESLCRIASKTRHSASSVSVNQRLVNTPIQAPSHPAHSAQKEYRLLTH